MRRPRHIVRWCVVVILALLVLCLPAATPHLNPAERVGVSEAHSIVEWEFGNFLSKWLHRVYSALPWNSSSSIDQQILIKEYFNVATELNYARWEAQQTAATLGTSDRSMVDAEMKVDGLSASLSNLKDDVEEILESNISSVLCDEGYCSRVGFILPPVDIRLTQPPKLLVTSPRDRIERSYETLLEPSVSITESERMEQVLRDKYGLSALVTDIGGLATYPASIVDTLPLRTTLRVASHEWMHHFLFFRPLGRNMYASNEMITLNETLADIAGNEIGDRAYVLLGGVIPDESPGIQPPGIEDETRFDFVREMRTTRLRVDSLLAAGDAEGAESYMEDRRKIFVENGYNIRKLNQAYFAFHGTYGTSPSSISPIAVQLTEYWTLVPDLGEFVTRVAGFSSYQQFLEDLESVRTSKD